MSITEKLKEKYKDHPVQVKSWYDSDPLNEKLSKKWECNTPSGWYGFSGLSGEPDVVQFIADEFLDYVKQNFPDFEINQLKRKFHRYCIYLDKIGDELKSEISAVTRLMEELAND